ncbi:hypothetical protein M9H77_29834 [Catharanthus roseus]|uniref:Uncharacterized protein n=1 Tax=Catharanthus roseus TaxID=4058 RepID=A0ACB9ZVI9_CATRO|nr:hypothetical protein M9H77_29834 [Catharanthus roseus]
MVTCIRMLASRSYVSLDIPDYIRQEIEGRCAILRKRTEVLLVCILRKVHWIREQLRRSLLDTVAKENHIDIHVYLAYEYGRSQTWTSRGSKFKYKTLILSKAWPIVEKELEVSTTISSWLQSLPSTVVKV